MSDEIELCTQAKEVPSASQGLQNAHDIFPAASKLPEPASLFLDLGIHAPKPCKEVRHELSSPAKCLRQMSVPLNSASCSKFLL